MALGRPVVCNIREDGLKFCRRDGRELPIIRAEPATLVAVLRDWLTARRNDLARWRGVAAIRGAWHNPRDVARGLIVDYMLP